MGYEPNAVQYRYTAVDSAGREKKGTVEAVSEADAAGKLKQQGLFRRAISRHESRDAPITSMRELMDDIFDDDQDNGFTFDIPMVVMAILSMGIVLGRTHIGIEYIDMGLALFIAFCFCCWRAYVVKELLKGCGPVGEQGPAGPAGPQGLKGDKGESHDARLK